MRYQGMKVALNATGREFAEQSRMPDCQMLEKYQRKTILTYLRFRDSTIAERGAPAYSQLNDQYGIHISPNQILFLYTCGSRLVEELAHRTDQDTT